MRLWNRAATALPQRVPADKQEAVAKEIEADIRKFVDETVPLVQGRALRLAPTTVGAVLEEKFTEDELRQVLAMLENPAYLKYQTLAGDMQRALTEKLLADARPEVEPRLRTLEETVARRLGVTPNNAAPASPPASGRR